MTDVAEVVVKVKADTSGLQQGMTQANNIVQTSSKGMQGALAGVVSQAKGLLPALGVGALVAFGKAAFVAADRLNDLSQRTGIAGSTLSALNISLLQSGSSVEDFAGSVNRMNNLIGEAAKGTNQEAIKAFDDLGLSVRRLQSLSPEEQFFAIAKELGNIKDQAAFTNAGMAIFGRSFSNIAPLIKEANGNLEEFVETQKRNGQALTQEQLDKIDEWGDKWVEVVEGLKLSMANALPVIQLYLDGIGAIIDILKAPAYGGAALGEAIGKTLRGNPNVTIGSKEDLGLNETVQYGQVIDPIQSAKDRVQAQKNSNKYNIRGDNKGLLKNEEAEKIKKAEQALRDYNIQLQREHEYASMAPADAVARKAYYDTLELAQKAGKSNAEDLARANEELARSNEANAKSMQEAERFTAELKDQFAQTAGSMIFQSKNAADAVKNLTQALAEMIAKRYILGSISDGLFGSGGSSGMLGGLFSSLFGGGVVTDPNAPLPWLQGRAIGDENVPRDMAVNVHQGEMIIPRVQAEAIRNGSAGGSTVVVNQYFQVSNDVPSLIDAHIRQATQPMVAAAHESVFSAIQKGGREARIVGRRN